MRAATLSKAGGWGVVVAVVCLWIGVVARAFAEADCTYDCWRYQFKGIYLGTATFTVLAAGGWLLVRGYRNDERAASTPASLLAKSGRLVAYASFPLALASLGLMIFVGPIGAVAIAVWNVAAGAAVSEAARRLDRRVRPAVVSNEMAWLLAVVITACLGWVLWLTTNPLLA